jgi:hypothetical protein
MSLAIPAYATTCTADDGTVTSGDIGTEFNNCTLAGTAGTVTFSGFSLSAGATGTLDASVTGNTLSFVFNPTGEGTEAAYTLSYTASCASCGVTGANDTVSGSGNYSYSLTGATASGTHNSSYTYSPTVTSETPATNTGNYLGSGFNTLMTLDVTIAATTASTPEPTSLILFGSGFLAIGLAARKRRKA